MVWLGEQGIIVTRRAYHLFFKRVLRVMPVAMAKTAGVDVALLRAVRVRHKLPLDPSGARVVSTKKAVRHDSPKRRRPITAEPRPKRPKALPTAAHSPRGDYLNANQLTPVKAIVTAPVAKDAPAMRGTAEAPIGYADWNIVNGMATDKLAAKNRSVLANYQGRVINIKTKQDYTEEDLVSLFELTPTEAQSCFRSFTK